MKNTTNNEEHSMNTMNNQRENSREKLSKIEGKWQKWNKPNQTKGKATETNRHVSKVKDKQSVICGSGDESRKGNSGTRFKLLNKYIFFLFGRRESRETVEWEFSLYILFQTLLRSRKVYSEATCTVHVDSIIGVPTL